MPKKFEVSAYYPLGPGLLLHVLTIEVDESLAWVKAHAEEFVGMAVHNGRALCALWVAEVQS